MTVDHHLHGTQNDGAGSSRPPRRHELGALTVEAMTDDGVGYRLVGGRRLAQYADDFFPPSVHDLEHFGPVGVVSLDHAGDLPVEATAGARVETFLLEIADVSPDVSGEVRRALRAFFEDDQAEALLRIGLSDPVSWSFDAVQPVDPVLGPDAGALDVCIATHHDGTFCVQHAHLVSTPRWTVCLWQPPCGNDGTAVPAGFPLPGSRVRHHFTRTDVSGWSGPERLARVVQDVMRHNEYQAERMSALIEDWELRFFRAFAAGSRHARDDRLDALQGELADLREFLRAIHLANKTLWRRAQNQPSFPPSVHREIIERCRELEAVLHERRAELRDSFSLLAGAASEQQARAAQGTEARMQALTGLATYATGAVLVPGLVAAFYGADVIGLPGQGERAGLVYLLIASVLAAVVTIAAFALARRRHR